MIKWEVPVNVKQVKRIVPADDQWLLCLFKKRIDSLTDTAFVTSSRQSIDASTSEKVTGVLSIRLYITIKKIILLFWVFVIST